MRLNYSDYFDHSVLTKDFTVLPLDVTLPTHCLLLLSSLFCSMFIIKALQVPTLQFCSFLTWFHSKPVFKNYLHTMMFYSWHDLCPPHWQIPLWFHLLHLSVPEPRPLRLCPRASSWKALQRGRPGSCAQGHCPGNSGASRPGWG